MSLRATSDSDGTRTGAGDFTAFGLPLAWQGQPTFGMGGQRLDHETSMYYLRDRYYAPTEGRFVTMDAYRGDVRVPVSLHRYMYANNEPVLYGDPSGKSTTLGGMMTGLGIGFVLTGLTLHSMNNYVVSDGARRWDLWDAVASTKFRADVRSKVEPLAIPLVEPEEPMQRHHTVPMYLWGVPDQQLVPLPFSRHVAIHGMLSKVELTIRDAETYATSVVPLGRYRSPVIRQLCQTMPGRIQITNGIWTVYEEVGDSNGLWETFRIERLRYEGGLTTCAGSTL